MALPISWTMRSLTPPLAAAIVVNPTAPAGEASKTQNDRENPYIVPHIQTAVTSTSWLPDGGPASPVALPGHKEDVVVQNINIFESICYAIGVRLIELCLLKIDFHWC